MKACVSCRHYDSDCARAELGDMDFIDLPEAGDCDDHDSLPAMTEERYATIGQGLSILLDTGRMGDLSDPDDLLTMAYDLFDEVSRYRYEHSAYLRGCVTPPSRGITT
jgi:hypothetical protein